MSLIQGRGSEVKDSIMKGKVDLKNAYIRMKAENESVAVRVLTSDDYVQYFAHGDFNKKLYNTPCIKGEGGECPYCVAHEKGGEDWKGLYRKERVLFAFGELSSGVIKLLDVSRTQAQKLLQQIEEYKEEINEGEVAFNLTRTGSGTSTNYVLNMITPKKLEKMRDQFDKFDDMVADTQFFVDRLAPKTPTYMVNLLEDADFDVEKHFTPELVATARAEKEALVGDKKGGATAIEETEEEAI